MTLAYWGSPCLSPAAPHSSGAGREARGPPSSCVPPAPCCPLSAALGSDGKEGALDHQHLPRLPTPPYLREGLERPQEQQPQRCCVENEGEHPGRRLGSGAGSAGRGSLAGAQPHAVKLPLLPQRAFALPLLSLPEAQWLTQNCFKEWATWQLEKKKTRAEMTQNKARPPVLFNGWSWLRQKGWPQCKWTEAQEGSSHPGGRDSPEMGGLQLVPMLPLHAHPKEKQDLSRFLLLTPTSSHFSPPWRGSGGGRLRGEPPPTTHPIHVCLT